MFGRRKKKDAEVDWTSGLGQVPAPAAVIPPTANPAAPSVAMPPGINLPPGVSFQVMQPTPEQMKDAMQMAERFMGRDLDGDGKVAGGTPAAGDVVGQLERLAKLHSSGALTDAEFATEKQKLLGA